MDEPTTIEEFAQHYELETGHVILLVLKYLLNDPLVIHPSVRRMLLNASSQDIEEALETIADDISNNDIEEKIRRIMQ